MHPINKKTSSTWHIDIASKIQELLEISLLRFGSASLIVPGGKTAKLILPTLSKEKLNWQNITIIPSDERWVPPSHPDSNENLIRSLLLKNQASKAKMIGFYTDMAKPENALNIVTEALEKIRLPVDVAFIGMGEDGHIASIFPNRPPIQNSDKLCTIIGEDHARISLTPPFLLNSRSIILAIIGEKKLKTLQSAMQPGSNDELPVRHILQQTKTPVHIYTY